MAKEEMIIMMVKEEIRTAHNLDKIKNQDNIKININTISTRKKKHMKEISYKEEILKIIEEIITLIIRRIDRIIINTMKITSHFNLNANFLDCQVIIIF